MLLRRLSPLHRARDLARMDPDKKQHLNKHRRRIEDVQKVLVLQQEAVIAHQVFHDAENGPEHDEAGTPVEGVDVSTP